MSTRTLPAIHAWQVCGTERSEASFTDAAGGVRILVVEDEAAVRELLKLGLEGNG